MSPRTLAPLIVSLALASLFFWTSLTKAADPGAFMAAIGDYGLVWEPLLGLAAWSVIGMELVAVAGLGLRRRWGAAVAIGLLLVFLAVLGYGISLGLDIECGCFGSGRESQGLTLQQAFGLDLALLAASTWLWWTQRAGSRTLETKRELPVHLPAEEAEQTEEAGQK